MRLKFFALVAVSASALAAQSSREQKAESRDLSSSAAKEPVSKPIQDNSFLLEEAYNQEAAVVQHISTLFFDRRISTWLYALTDEWPLNGQRHQLSVTLPLENAVAGRGNSPALGDIALNYRLQLVGSGETRLAVAPRLTVLFPTADEKLGGGTLAFQGAVASSYMAMPRLALHTNAGLTFTPSGQTSVGGERLLDFYAGQSAIWLVHPRVNLMLEGVATSTETLSATGARAREAGYTLSPGIRWAYNFASGLQIVPGLAFPIGIGANRDQRAVLLYLSFEHVMPGLRKMH
jgi:hypothetical protein